MSFVHARFIEEALTPTDRTEIGATPSWDWEDIESILNAEWEIGGPAMPTDAICALVAGE
jgi:hypothetical protein